MEIIALPPLPPPLLSRSPAAWLTVFGPGAIIASLTIGTGELIFSSRGGAIFGYRILFLFMAICVLKWILLFSTARHMVVTGVHPFRRWMAIPFGPRGWLPTLFFLFAAVCIPIWVSFHCSVLGALLAMLGTLYGTLEVAPIILREMRLAVQSDMTEQKSNRLRCRALWWCAMGAFAVLAVSFANQLTSGENKPPGLTDLLIPANLFTGVMSCGLICLLNVWMDRILPKSLRFSMILTLANVAAGILFVLLGLKGYSDYGGWRAMYVLFSTVAAGWVLAPLVVKVIGAGRS